MCIRDSVGIDRDDAASAQILSAFQVFLRDPLAEAFRLRADGSGEVAGQAVLVNDREHVDAGGTRRAEDLHDVTLGIDMAVFPAVELSHHLVTGTTSLGIRDIKTAGEARIIGDDVEKVFSALKCRCV